MAEREIVIARRSGALRGPDGERIVIRQGRTIADSDHPAVLAHPRAWAPVMVTLRTDGSGDTPDADNWDPAGAVGPDPDMVEQAEQFARLAQAARAFDVLPDQPLTASEVVDHLAAILDEWSRRPGEAAADAPTSDREVRREWARANGFEVADKGRLPQAVEDAYAAAHPQD